MEILKSIVSVVAGLSPSTAKRANAGVSAFDGLRRTVGSVLFMRSAGDARLADLAAYIEERSSMPQHVFLLHVRTSNDAHVPLDQRVVAREIGRGVFVVRLTCGFEDLADVPLALTFMPEPRIDWRMTTVFVDGKRTDLASMSIAPATSGMSAA